MSTPTNLLNSRLTYYITKSANELKETSKNYENYHNKIISAKVADFENGIVVIDRKEVGISHRRIPTQLLNDLLNEELLQNVFSPELESKLEQLANDMLKIEVTMALQNNLRYENEKKNMTSEEKIQEIKNIIEKSKDKIGTISENNEQKIKIIDMFVDPVDKLIFWVQIQTIPFTKEELKVKVTKIMAEALEIPETDVRVTVHSNKYMDYELNDPSLYQKMYDLMNDNNNPYKKKLEVFFGKMVSNQMPWQMTKTFSMIPIEELKVKKNN